MVTPGNLLGVDFVVSGVPQIHNDHLPRSFQEPQPPKFNTNQEFLLGLELLGAPREFLEIPRSFLGAPRMPEELLLLGTNMPLSALPSQACKKKHNRSEMLAPDMVPNDVLQGIAEYVSDTHRVAAQLVHWSTSDARSRSKHAQVAASLN